MGDCGHGQSALATLTAAGCLGPECIAVHLNDWEESDFGLVAPGGPLAGMPVVHCPLSHRYFGHHPFPLERLRTLGVNLCVGTDSPASNGSFSLLEELRAAADVFPSLDPRARGWKWLPLIRRARWVWTGDWAGCARGHGRTWWRFPAGAAPPATFMPRCSAAVPRPPGS